MFIATALVYPCVLALLCTGAGLLTDRASGGALAGALLPAVGAAALIAVSQLTTYTVFAAASTPYAIALVSLAGFVLGWSKLRTLARGWRRWRWQLGTGALVYALALAPVLAAGRPTFSSFQALTDSAFHMMGADYLLRHGQDYAHLDLRNSYGQYLNAYYNTGYPSGADTLFGGSSFLLGLPLIWTFQPFNALMLAIAAGPAWVLARRMGLAGGWAALATLTATVGALVYGYELVASVKEIVALAMILTLGALTVQHARWLWRGPTGVLPAAIALAAGISALGVGFGAWGLAAVAILGAVAIGEVGSCRRQQRRLLGTVAVAAAAVLVCALSTWLELADSLHVAQGIAATSNPGNLTGSLRAAQVFGTWLTGSYQQVPTGGLLVLSYVIAALTLAMAVLGAIRIVSLGEHVLAGWIALILAAGIALERYATAWVSAKAIMLSSPVVVLLAWGGIAGLWALAGARRRRAARPVDPHAQLAEPARAVRDPYPRAPASSVRQTGRASSFNPAAAGAVLAAVAIVGGVGVSDAVQYHASNLAPTARYEELASIDQRFAGQGPALDTDFDEYALYELRDLDVGGLNFMYPPVGLRTMPGHGYPVDLDRVSPAALSAYPLIVTRRDPTVSEPPSAYRLAWQGSYYQVWRRRPHAPVAFAHLGLQSTHPVRCSSVRRLARVAKANGARLVAAVPPQTVRIDVAGGEHPAWKHTPPGLVMSGAGALHSTFVLPHAGVWDLWLKGEIMPTVSVSVDGRALASIGGELDGNPHNPDTTAPVPVRLSAGAHRLTIARAGGAGLAPGDGGWAILHEALLTPAGEDVDRLVVTPPERAGDLCGGLFDWIEVVRA